jgi:hypothetical protein
VVIVGKRRQDAVNAIANMENSPVKMLQTVLIASSMVNITEREIVGMKDVTIVIVWKDKRPVLILVNVPPTRIVTRPTDIIVINPPVVILLVLVSNVPKKMDA